MKMSKSIVILSTLIFLNCATTKMIREPIKDTDIINAGFNKSWSAMVASISEMSLPIESIEKESGLLTTKMVILGGYNTQAEIDRISYRPSVFLGVWSQGRYSLSIFLQNIENNRTQIKVTNHVEAYESNVTKTWYVCQSKSIIEQQIFYSIRNKLGLNSVSNNQQLQSTTLKNERVDLLDELISSDDIKYLNIKRVLKQYILVTVTSATPMKVGEEYTIIRPLKNNKEIGQAEVVRINKNNVVLKILQNVQITVSDKIKY